MNKIPHDVRGIVIRSGFHTLMCEQGHLHEEKVKFDQVDSAGIGGGEHFERQLSMNGRKIP